MHGPGLPVLASIGYIGDPLQTNPKFIESQISVCFPEILNPQAKLNDSVRDLV